MKVLDFGSGGPLLVRQNWRDNDPGGPIFVGQSYIAEILGGGPHEVHCYDRVAITEGETEKTLVSDVGEIMLHNNRQRLPRSVDMICAFNPDPRVVFAISNRHNKHALEYSSYIHELAFMVNTRLRVGGILAIQFDNCMIPPAQEYDGTIPFLDQAVPDVPHHYYMHGIWHVHQNEKIRPVQPFQGLHGYKFESLHLFQKVPSKK